MALVKRMWFAILVNIKKLCGVSAELFCPFTKPRISTIKTPYIPSFSAAGHYEMDDKIYDSNKRYVQQINSDNYPHIRQTKYPLLKYS
ncbi:MAG: hypothetical protein IJA70_05740 [Oscillospiraceae bacterium]|nr:hypothetical protein [Oscillospiraceae bacterium]